MPTREERREVAARLRKLAPGSDWLDMIAEACGLNPRETSNCLHGFTGELCDRLSDLIEPEPESTCRIIPGGHDGGAGMSARWWTCGECGSQVAISAVVFVEHDGPCIPDRAARYEHVKGELWDTSLLVGEKGLAMSEPRFCPGCGKKTLRAAWEYHVSPAVVPPDIISRQLAHMMSEVNKAYDAFVRNERNERIAEALMDNSHAVETGLRVPGVDMDGVMRGVIEKNCKRGYYGGDVDEQG